MDTKFKKTKKEIIIEALKMLLEKCLDEYNFYCDILDKNLKGTIFEKRVKSYPEITPEIATKQKEFYSKKIDLINSLIKEIS